MSTSLIQSVLQIATTAMLPLFAPLLFGFMACLFAEEIIDLLRHAISKRGRRFR